MTPTRWLAAALLLACARTDDADDVLAALRHGMRAHAPAERARAGETLRALDARPLEGAADWGARWARDSAPAYRDRALGPAYMVRTLPAGGHVHLDQTFLAGQRARVAASADPSLAFDLAVAVAGSRVGCAEGARVTSCSWVPDYTARYSIDLTSRGKRAASFYLVVR